MAVARSMRTGRIRVLTASFISMLMGGVIGLLAVPAGAVACSPTTSGVATALTNCVVGA
jgi:hypothetical protein